MLSVYFGDMPEAIYNTATYFKNSYRSSWITDPYAVSIIKDVDRSVVVSENVIESPVLGSISPLQLSGGVKTLLLMRFDRKHILTLLPVVTTVPSGFSTWRKTASSL